MGQKDVNISGSITLQWSGDLTIRRMSELKKQVEQALATTAEVTIAITADAECDIALMQLLCAAHRTAARQGKTLTLQGEIPDQLKMVMNLAGFSRHIGCSRDQTESCLWKMLHQQRAEHDASQMSHRTEFGMGGPSDL